MPNITLVRIDNRLIHGQIITSWVRHTKSNLVLVANDGVANNDMRKELMGAIVPDGIATRFFTLEKTAEVIHKASDSQHILLILENPMDTLWLKQNGVPIDYLNVGNMHGGDGKKALAKAAFASEEEITAFKELIKLGVKIEFQLLPVEPLVNIENAILNS